MKLCILIMSIAISCLSFGQSTFDFGISKMNRFTGSITPVIDLPGTGEFNPAWSPDRKKIAFDVVSPTDPHRVGIATAHGSLLTIFSGTADGANNPTWSADGSSLAVDKVPMGDLSIYTIDISTGATTFLISDAIDPAFSHRGGGRQYLAFFRPSDGMIYTYHMPSGVITPITSGENPKWSPNDRAIVYSLGGDVYTIRINNSGGPGGLPILQAGDPIFNESRPDYISLNEIVFHADYPGDFDLYRKRIRGSSSIVRIGGNTGANDFDPDYNRSGRFILFSEGQTSLPGVSIRELPSSTFSVSPNPARDYINTTFELSTSENISIELYDLQGKMIMKKYLGLLNEGYHEVSILLSQNVIPGIHNIRIHGDKEFNQTLKVIIQK